MPDITITIGTPVDALVLANALHEGIKAYETSIAFWESDERSMSPEGRAAVIDTLYGDKRRLEIMKVDVDRKLEAIRRRGGV